MSVGLPLLAQCKIEWLEAYGFNSCRAIGLFGRLVSRRSYMCQLSFTFHYFITSAAPFVLSYRIVIGAPLPSQSPSACSASEATPLLFSFFSNMIDMV